MNSNKKRLLSISELSMHLGLINEKNGKPANHILRFWESKFKEIKPTIFKGKRRYYNSAQIKKIEYIKYLLREKGLTINGVKGLLKNKKNIDEIDKNNINEEYLRSNIKKRSKNILKKIKEIKKYGKKNSLKGANGS